jgi:hypothetical protein
MCVVSPGSLRPAFTGILFNASQANKCSGMAQGSADTPDRCLRTDDRAQRVVVAQAKARMLNHN